jgi:hypothetical protein
MAKSKGVSLVELIVVLGIITIFLGIFFPAVGRVREAARQTACKNNLRQINLGLIQQLELVGIPPTNPIDKVGGWAIEILPYLEQANIKQAIPTGGLLDQLDPAFYSRPRIFECPTQFNNRPTNELTIAATHYMLIASPSFEKREGYKIAEAPMSIEFPWASSPEMTRDRFTAEIENENGPHYGGAYFIQAWQRGVEFTGSR